MLALPFFLPLITAVFLLSSFARKTKRWFLCLSCFSQILMACYWMGHCFLKGPEALVMGGWVAPYGISLVIDLFSAVMVWIAAVVTFFCVIYGFFEISPKEEHPFLYPLIQLFVGGAQLAFITGDLFNLYVAFEILLIATYSLFVIHTKERKLFRVYPLVTTNLLGSALFLVGLGALYAVYGTLNIAHLSAILQTLEQPSPLYVISGFFILAFGIKGALFPLYHWLPNSLPILPNTLGALFSGFSTKIGIYCLVRLFATVLPHNMNVFYQTLLVLAPCGMILGVLGAVSKGRVRGILAYHSVSQLGFMVLALAFFSPMGIAACLLYMLHHALVKPSLFLLGGAMRKGSKTDDLQKLGGWIERSPLLAFLFLIQAMSLAGLPPFSGFWAKYLILWEGIHEEQFVLVFIALFTGLLTLFSMLKIWIAAFWSSESSNKRSYSKQWVPLVWIGGGLSAMSWMLFLGAEWWIRIVQEASQQVLNQELYIQTVFGGPVL